MKIFCLYLQNWFFPINKYQVPAMCPLLNEVVWDTAVLDAHSQTFISLGEIKHDTFQKSSSLQMDLVWEIVFDVRYLGLVDNIGEL